MTTAAGSAPSSPGPSRLQRARDYWRAGWAFADARLANVAKGLVPGWWMFLLSSAVAAMLVLTLHIVTAWGLDARSVVWQTTALIPTGTLALALIALLIWAYWRIRTDSRETGPYAVALLTSAVTIGVAAQAFAAINVYLAQRGVVSGSPPSFLSAEASYAWHLFDAVPFLEVPNTLHWSEPSVLQDSVSGALLLAFKIVVIGPFIRLVFSVYRLLEKLRVEGAQKGPGVPSALMSRPRISPGAAAAVFTVGLLLVAGVYAGSSVVFDPGSGPNRWLRERIPDAVEVPSVEVPLTWAKEISERFPEEISERFPEEIDVPSVALPASWAETVPQWLATAFLLCAVGVIFVLAVVIDVRASGARWRMLGPLGAYVCLVLVLTELWSATTLTLLHSGVISANRAIPSSEQVPNGVAYYLWHATDVIPALDVPGTLNWSLRYEYADRGSAWLLLVYKIAFLTVLAFPLMRVVRMLSPISEPRREREPTFLAAAAFTGILRKVEADLDAVHALVVRVLRRPPGKARDARGAQTGAARVTPRRSLDQEPYRRAQEARGTASARLRELEAALKDVQTVFGIGDVAETANAVLVAAEQRLQVITIALQSGRRRSEPRVGKKATAPLNVAESTFSAAATAYRRAAMDALLHKDSGDARAQTRVSESSRPR